MTLDPKDPKTTQHHEPDVVLIGGAIMALGPRTVLRKVPGDNDAIMAYIRRHSPLSCRREAPGDSDAIVASILRSPIVPDDASGGR